MSSPSSPSVRIYTQGGGTASSSQFPSSPVIQTRNPAATDIQGSFGPFPIGQEWVNQSTGAVYSLISFSPSNGSVSANWIQLNSAGGLGIETLTGNSGGAVNGDISHNLNVVGSGLISVAGNPGSNTLTVSYTGGAAVETLTGNSGGAVGPNGSDNISIVGSGTISVVGNPGTNTLTISSSGATFPSPAAQVNISDDFLSTGFQGTAHTSPFIIDGQLSWAVSALADASSASFVRVPSTSSSHPGILSNLSLASSDSDIALISLNGAQNSSTGDPTTADSFLVGGGQITINWVFNIVNLSTNINTYQLNVGLASVYFGYNSGSNLGQWVLVGESSTTNTDTVVTTGWHNAQIIISANATTLTFIMDGVTLGTQVGQTPLSSPDSPTISINATDGTTSAGTLEIDLFYLNQTLTTSR